MISGREFASFGLRRFREASGPRQLQNVARDTVRFFDKIRPRIRQRLPERFVRLADNFGSASAAAAQQAFALKKADACRTVALVTPNSAARSSKGGMVCCRRHLPVSI